MTATNLRLAAVALSLTPTLCLAWGADGHRLPRRQGHRNRVGAVIINWSILRVVRVAELADVGSLIRAWLIPLRIAAEGIDGAYHFTAGQVFAASFGRTADSGDVYPNKEVR